MNHSNLWIQGYMPVQFLLVFVFFFFAFSIVQYFLKRIGKPVPAFGQAILILLTTYGILNYLIVPPIPSSLMYQYMGLAVVFTFLFISSREQPWVDFKRSITETVAGKTRGRRFIRATVFMLIPLLAGIGTWNLVKPPEITAPIELHGYGTPPATITVYPPEYFIQKHLHRLNR